jgi:glycosyltransferase involved in cell wall biosynthesis
VFLFAGEMSYAAGIDILIEALVIVCQSEKDVQFVLVGDGSLKSAMEAHVSRAGFGHRCRFTGALPPDEFERLLAACDFVVIPARERQDSGLAEQALAFGKPVLTTHVAQFRGIVHGHNGLVAYDCPNSLVWGLRELLAKPLQPYPQPAAPSPSTLVHRQTV